MREKTSTAGFAPLFAVGLGPGGEEHFSPEASAVLARAEVIVGYSAYVARLPRRLLAGKRVVATGMTGETARAKAAIDAARQGEITAVVCSGDPGVYALAGLLLELIERQGLAPEDFPFRVVPGIPAVCAAAALLGAPLMHDFACVSLSDLLTPWPLIAARLEHAFAGDFVVALYNPRSKRRTRQLDEALATALRHRSADTPVGIVKNAFRPGEYVRIAPLGSVPQELVDMLTLLIIGNSASRIVPGRGAAPLAWENGARLLTPRGYSEKYADAFSQKLED